MTTRSWVDVPAGSPFPLANLPYGLARRGDQDAHAVMAVGEHAVDLHAAACRGLLPADVPAEVLAQSSLNDLFALGRPVWEGVRRRVAQLLDVHEGELRDDRDAVEQVLVAQADLTLLLPVAVGDYVDFYSSIHHATNLGRILRPDGEPLLANWRHLPVGYHGRAGTLVASGTEVVRPRGLVASDDGPRWQATDALDFELEVGAIVGVGSELGTRIPAGSVEDHVVGLVLVNDWSARDVQAYEYQPLGPHLGKSFATSLSPWIVTLDALRPHRVPAPPQDPPVASYLRTEQDTAYTIELEVLVQSEQMRREGLEPVCISRNDFSSMYWTIAQQLAHLTVNGASTRPGDLLASGTVSGPVREEAGSLMELTWRGRDPLTLPTGERRGFLADGDRVVLRAWCGQGDERFGFGSVMGTIASAKED